MNPFALLLGLIGAGALSGLGSVKKDADLKNPKATKQEEPVPDTSTSTTQQDTSKDEPVTEEPTTQEPTSGGGSAPEAPSQSGPETDGGSTDPVIADGSVDVIAGRVATLSPAGDDVTGIRIVSGTDHGTVTVNPDNSLALVLTKSDYTGSDSFTYEATHTDGSVTLHEVGLNVAAGSQEAGWATGEATYMLATDDAGDLIVETGENHITVYVSGSPDALSLSDIAAMEGISVSGVTGSFLESHGYGQSEALALDEQASAVLWNAVTPNGSETSNWLLFERGYTYEGAGINGVFTAGESELHPIYVGAWGEGERPEIAYEFKVFFHAENVVIEDLHFTGGLGLYEATNIIVSDVEVENDEFSVVSSSGVTVRDSYVHDVSSVDRAYISGLFVGGTQGVLIEGTVLDHNGWSDDWSDQPDSMSHNLYIDTGGNAYDITVRDNIIMRASASGAHIRPGGYIEDNVFLDNNAAVDTPGGKYYDYGSIGHYTLFADNLITSAGYRIGDKTGAFAEGLKDEALMTTLVDNIVAHLADPNNPDEIATKIWSNSGYLTLDAFYDDTIVWNWESINNYYKTDFTDQNSDGLDPDAMNATTIQNYVAQLLGKSTATIEDLAELLALQEHGQLPDQITADDIIAYFQKGFGVDDGIKRSTAETIRFVPNELAEGIRWDNRLNWTTGDLPGTVSGDSVALGGNHVVFGTNTTIDTLDLGGGDLNVYGGRLTVEGGLTGTEGGHLNIEGAGQVWVAGSDAEGVAIDVTGGRFVNTGQMSGADLTAIGGQTILATSGAEYDVDAGHMLEIHDDAKVGFDGADGGTAILDLHEGASLSFLADSDGLGEISEFRSGAYGDAPDVQSGIDLGNSVLEIDLTGLSTSAGTAFTLMDADEIVGLFDSAEIGGLGARDATIVVDYQTDTVTLKLTAGTGAISIQTLGQETDVTSGEEDLWATLTADHGLMEETAAAMAPDEDELLGAAA